MPIAVTEVTGKVTKEVFKANVVEGSGSDLPAIMGNQSMEKKKMQLLSFEKENSLWLSLDQVDIKSNGAQVQNFSRLCRLLLGT